MMSSTDIAAAVAALAEAAPDAEQIVRFGSQTLGSNGNMRTR